MRMASPNDNGNLMDEFEESFQECLHAMTKKEPNTGVTHEEIELEVQKTTNKFIDVARQMEAFFLQKRFLLCTLKPEMLIKDENLEIRNEIARKEMLLNKHSTRLEEWKAHLADLQQQQGSTGGGSYTKPSPQGQSSSELRLPAGYPAPSAAVIGLNQQMPMQQSVLQNQLQQQQQQQHMMQAQQMHQMQQPYGKFNKSMK